MRAILSSAAAALAYVSIGTMLAAGFGFGYLWSTGILNQDKGFKILAVLHDIPLPPDDELLAQERAKDEENRMRDLSYQDIERIRGLEARNLELKKQAVELGLSEVRSESIALSEAKSRFDAQKDGFVAHLEKIRDEALNEGISEIRKIWETVKPATAKDQAMQFVEAGAINDVVLILSGMQVKQQSKIIEQFQTAEEKEVLDEIITLIRQGVPETTVIDDALGATAGRRAGQR
ncbi:MAG: hypothetical protein KDA42_02660 [Planctomycetales bacterium]|nr:hypothetical protein [Planctomycetales bacterium]